MSLNVYYDGGCPLCRREIHFYRQFTADAEITWVDISDSVGAELTRGLTRCAALKRLHVSDDRGRLFSGAQAFAKIWEAIPRLRLLGRIAQILPFIWILEAMYRLFLAARPAMQKVARIGGLQ